MENVENVRKERTWVNVIAFILLLLGIYGTVRTAINIVAFDKYPFGGVFPSIPISFGNYQNMQPAYTQKEIDCMYLPTYYSPDGMTLREPNAIELANTQEQQKNCLESVKESRNSAKIKDISQSLPLLFMGLAIPSYRKIFK